MDSKLWVQEERNENRDYKMTDVVVDLLILSHGQGVGSVCFVKDNFNVY